MFVGRLMLSSLMLATLGVTEIAQTKVSLDELSWLNRCWEGRQRDAVIEEICRPSIIVQLRPSM